MFNSGQVTLPKKWREQFDTRKFIAEETTEGLLIKPLQEAVYYEDEESFGLHFPMGISADELEKKLKEANEKLS